MPDVTDLIGLSIDKNPVEFASTFDDIIRQKAAVALENKKTELAKSIYGEENPDLDADDDDSVDVDTASDSEEDFDDIELDDVDFDDDLEDLNLDDLDLDIDLDGDSEDD